MRCATSSAGLLPEPSLFETNLTRRSRPCVLLHHFQRPLDWLPNPLEELAEDELSIALRADQHHRVRLSFMLLDRDDREDQENISSVPTGRSVSHLTSHYIGFLAQNNFRFAL